MKSALSTALRVGALLALSTSVAFAQEGDVNWGLGVGAGLAVGLAAAGGGIGQGLSASRAIEGMARNPAAAGNLQTPMIIALVFTETLTLFSLVIAGRLAGLF